MRKTLFLVVLLSLAGPMLHGASDILIAGFEGPDYKGWTVKGDAFSEGPAASGHTSVVPRDLSREVGHGYAGSTGEAIGSLTSPHFTIERNFINLLVSGGEHWRKACVNLVVDGQIVRSATGLEDWKEFKRNTLRPHTWDVREFKGKQAVIRIVDEVPAVWGHINVDNIVQSDTPRAMPETLDTFPLRQQHFVFKLGRKDARVPFVKMYLYGKIVHEARGMFGGEDRWLTWDVGAHRGKTVDVVFGEWPNPTGDYPARKSSSLAREASGALVETEVLYRETWHPQFHFSAKKGWLNDPNGLVFYKGEYHLFFQYNPYGRGWINHPPGRPGDGFVFWGHATSTDLVHWKEMDPAIVPDELGSAHSGGGLVDWNNTAGFQTGKEKPIVLFYTSAGGWLMPPRSFSQSLAYSIDRGRAWVKYDGNPVLENYSYRNRDPKVVWHEPSKQWVMALYLGRAGAYALFGSKNLKQWTSLSEINIPGTSECPEIFEIAVEGEPANKKWVFWGANGKYVFGSFEGARFIVEEGPFASSVGDCYAAQNFSDIPASDGRVIQMSWLQLRDHYPDMPFSQQMAFPREVTLRNTDEGPRLHFQPAREIEALYKTTESWNGLALVPGDNPLQDVRGELFDIEAEIEPVEADTVGFRLRGVPLTYDVKRQSLQCLREMKLPLDDGRIRLRILVDRASVEVFGNGGRHPLYTGVFIHPGNTSLVLFSRGGTAKVRSLKVRELKPAWE